MSRVVESVAPEYGDVLLCETVITKNMEGAMRYGELSKNLGRPAPVPSIFIDGKLIFEVTPGREELKDCLDRYLDKLG
ncbi:hypothetical protein ACFL7E_03025 [Thermodesulfobacteriota bacterium]